MSSPYAPGQTIVDACGNYTPIIPDLPPNGAWDNGGPNGSVQVVTGAFDDPNGNVTPATKSSPALYYQDNAAISFWQWSVSGQNWEPIVT